MLKTHFRNRYFTVIQRKCLIIELSMTLRKPLIDHSLVLYVVCRRGTITPINNRLSEIKKNTKILGQGRLTCLKILNWLRQSS
jgi:hypothetical protein